jgi:hypothetical protein
MQSTSQGLIGCAESVSIAGELDTLQARSIHEAGVVLHVMFPYQERRMCKRGAWSRDGHPPPQHPQMGKQ